MFKKISFIITITIISAILLTPNDCFARGGGGRGGRGGGMMGGGMMGGGMMGGDMMGGGGMMGGMMGGGFDRTPYQQPVEDVNSFRTNRLLTYIVDANGVSVDPNSLSSQTLQNLLIEIGSGNRDVIDITRFNNVSQTRNIVLGQGDIDPNDPDPMMNVSLSGLNINAIIEMLIQWTGKAVLPSNESLGMTITVFSPERMRRSQALNLLKSAMREQGFVAETRNDIIYIVPSVQAKNIDAPILGPDDELITRVDTQEVVRKIFKINNYSPSTMGQLILPFLNSTAKLTAEETTQTLMVIDTVDSLIEAEKIIKQFDQNLAGTETKIIKVQHTDPFELSDMISAIMANNITSSGMLGGGMMGGMSGMQAGRGGTLTITTSNRGNDRNDRNNRNNRNDRGTTRTNNSQASMMGMGMFGASVSASASTIGSGKPEPILIPDIANKMIIATATPEDMLEIQNWAAKLDTETKVIWNPIELNNYSENQVVQKIYHLMYNTPEQLAQIIEPLLTEDGYLSAEQNTGTLMIRDTVGTLRQIEDIIKEFDKEEANPQVRQIFVVKEGDPREIVNIINTILSGEVSATGTRTTTGFGNTGRTTNNRNTGRTTNNRNTGRNTGRTGMGF